MKLLPSVALRHGLPCFPLRARAKTPATSHGFKDASTDPERIESWADEMPECNWGAALGGHGIFAVDVDPRSGGDESFRTLCSLHPELPVTLTQSTGGGGWHYLFRSNVTLERWPAKIAPGVDIKAAGGYIVVAESIHESGRAYEWLDGRAPIATAPPWLISRLIATTHRIIKPSPSDLAAPDLAGMNAAALAARLDSGYVQRGGQYFVRCVAHKDSDPSLAIRDAGGGKILWFCHGGCDRLTLTNAIREKLK